MSSLTKNIAARFEIDVPTATVELTQVVVHSLSRLLQYSDAVYKGGRDIDGINPEGDGLLIAENQVIDVCGGVIAEAIYQIVTERYGTVVAADTARVIYGWQKQNNKLSRLLGVTAVSFADDTMASISVPGRVTGTFNTAGLRILEDEFNFGRDLLDTIEQLEAEGIRYGEIIEQLRLAARFGFQKTAKEWIAKQLDQAQALLER